MTSSSGEPQIKVVLFSDLFGTFVVPEGERRRRAGHYRRLAAAGVDVVFITGAPLTEAEKVLAGLVPPPLLVANGGATAVYPEGHLLRESSGRLKAMPTSFPGQKVAAESIIRGLEERGLIVIAFGIADAPDDEFLQCVAVAALIPGPDSKPCLSMPRTRVTYTCKHRGPKGWNEWAELLLRRVEVIGPKL